MDIFCKINNNDIPSYTIYEDDIVKVILDMNQKDPGHSLIITKKHYQDLYDIDSVTLNYINEVSIKIAKLLTEKLQCNGITLMQNNGIAQDVKHFHLHIIPKYIKSKKMNIEDVYNIIKSN